MDKAVAILGDLMLDRTVFGRANRLSPEAPIPVLEIENMSEVAGGAANVAANICAIAPGLDVYIAGCINPADLPKYTSLSHAKYSILCPCQETNTKLRFIDTRTNYQLLRADNEVKADVTSYHLPVKETISWLADIPDLGIIILSDYDKGALTPPLIRHIIDWAGNHSFRSSTLVDTRRKDPTPFKNAGFITPNLHEFEVLCEYLGMRICENDDTAMDYDTMAGELLEALNISSLLLKMSEQGMTLYEQVDLCHCPPRFRDIVDVTGAGDTALAALATGLIFHPECSTEQLCKLASYYAGEVCMKSGTAVPTTSFEDAWEQITQES